MFKLKKGVFMNNYKNWTELEFKAYLCLYAADSNFEYNADERKLIESKFDVKTIEMEQGNKISRFIAWTFLDDGQQKNWNR